MKKNVKLDQMSDRDILISLMERVAGLEQMLKRRSKPQAFVERLPGTPDIMPRVGEVIQLLSYGGDLRYVLGADESRRPIQAKVTYIEDESYYEYPEDAIWRVSLLNEFGEEWRGYMHQYRFRVCHGKKELSPRYINDKKAVAFAEERYKEAGAKEAKQEKTKAPKKPKKPTRRDLLNVALGEKEIHPMFKINKGSKKRSRKSKLNAKNLTKKQALQQWESSSFSMKRVILRDVFGISYSGSPKATVMQADFERATKPTNTESDMETPINGYFC
jgi:hypothetical protein